MTDQTAELPRLRRAAPAQITETAAAVDVDELLDGLTGHLDRIRELASTRDRAGTRERIHGAIAALQQLDAHLTTPGDDTIDDQFERFLRIHAGGTQ